MAHHRGRGLVCPTSNATRQSVTIVTEWEEFRAPDFPAVKAALRTPVIIDGRNMYEPKDVRAAGLEYFSIGRW